MSNITLLANSTGNTYKATLEQDPCAGLKEKRVYGSFNFTDVVTFPPPGYQLTVTEETFSGMGINEEQGGLGVLEVLAITAVAVVACSITICFFIYYTNRQPSDFRKVVANDMIEL